MNSEVREFPHQGQVVSQGVGELDRLESGIGFRRGAVWPGTVPLRLGGHSLGPL